MKCGRKKRDRDELVVIKQIDFNERHTLRSLQSALESRGHKIGLATLSRMSKEYLFKTKQQDLSHCFR